VKKREKKKKSPYVKKSVESSKKGNKRSIF